MFSLDAMTRGQHAITTATSNSSLTSSSSSPSSSSPSFGLDNDNSPSVSCQQYGACEKRRRRGSRQRRAKSTSKSSNTTIEICDSASGSKKQCSMLLDDGARQEGACESISLYHEGGASSEIPLKDDNTTRSSPPPASLVRNKDDFMIRGERGNHNNNNSNDTGYHHVKVGRFRYVVAALIICGATLSSYATNTMYIAAIEMISNDVLQSGMTSLRAKHMSDDPLATSTNAALPGTCPVEADARQHSHVAALIEHGLLTLMNISEISANAHKAMQADAAALHADVSKRLAAGQLVDWTISERGYIFMAHNIGAILLAVPVGRLGLIYGSKLMIFWCTLLSSVRLLLLPTLAGHTPFWTFFTFEILFGGIGGNITIIGYPIAAAWLLPDEANFFVALIILATLCGTSATNFVSTQLLSAGLAWCWCYYLPGILSIVLAAVWFIWGADQPEQSRFVSRAELELLQANTIAKRNARTLAQHNRSRSDNSRNSLEKQEDPQTPLLAASSDSGGKVKPHNECRCVASFERDACPANQMVRKPNWTTILTCPTIWALVLVSFANHWTTKNANLWPTFFSNILHLSSSDIGIMLGIKGVFALVFGVLFVVVTRKLIVNRPFNMSLTAYRRWNQALAVSVYAVSVCLVVLLDCEIMANFAALLLQPIVSGFNSISVDQMPLDLSAEDSGLLVSVIRLIAVGDLVALPVSSYILSHAPNALAGNRHTWRLVWLSGLLTRLTTSLYFVMIAKSRPKTYSRLEPSGPCKTPPNSRGATAVATSTRGDVIYIQGTWSEA